MSHERPIDSVKWKLSKNDSRRRLTSGDKMLIGLGLFFLMVTVLTASSPGAYLSAFRSIENGMTQGQVIKIMGRPEGVKPDGKGGKRLHWSCDMSSGSKMRTGPSYRYFYVYLDPHGRVYLKRS